MKTRENVGITNSWAHLLLLVVVVLVLVGSSAQAAADEHKIGGSRRRRAAAAPPVMVPITLLSSAVDKGAGMYICLYIHIHASSLCFSFLSRLSSPGQFGCWLASTFISSDRCKELVLRPSVR